MVIEMKGFVKKEDVLTVIYEFIIENRFSHWLIARALRDLKTKILLMSPTTEARENIKAKKVIDYIGENGQMIYGHKCSNCGGTIDYEDKFCRHCGADLRDEQLLKENING